MEAYIGKIEPVSSELWKGNLSIGIYFAGCDYNCPSCNTPEFLQTKEEYVLSLKEVKKAIKESASQVHAVVFTGGEPTLHRQQLINLATYAKDLGLKVGINTNGSKTECIRSLLSLDILDFIAIDIKTPLTEDIFQKATRSQTFFKTSNEQLQDYKNTLKLLKAHDKKLEIEFNTLIIPSIISRKEDLFEIAVQIEDINAIWTLLPFQPETVVNKRFKEIKPPSMRFLEDLRYAIKKKYPKLRIFVD